MATRRPYEKKVAEVFGYPADSDSGEALRVRGKHECPFLQVRCPKPSQHRDFDRNIPFGACSVWHRGTGMSEPNPHVICPVRFTQDQQIFQDASPLLGLEDISEETVIIPELPLPMGRIDYILARCNAMTQDVLDFIVLEVMACSTTTTGDVLRSFHDILRGHKTEVRLKYGINFRQVISRMMVQVLAKAYACEKWGKRMIWAVQDVLYRYMQATTKVHLHSIDTEGLRDIDPRLSILFFVYGMELNKDRGIFELKLKEIYGGNKEDFAKILEPMEIPEAGRLLALIRQKVQSEDSAFRLGIPPMEGLARVARDIVSEPPEEYTPNKEPTFFLRQLQIHRVHIDEMSYASVELHLYHRPCILIFLPIQQECQGQALLFHYAQILPQ